MGYLVLLTAITHHFAPRTFVELPIRFATLTASGHERSPSMRRSESLRVFEVSWGCLLPIAAVFEKRTFDKRQLRRLKAGSSGHVIGKADT